MKQCLRTLNDRAESGEIQGIFWTLHKGEHGSEWGVSGDYRDMPCLAVERVGQAHKELKAYAIFKRIDPQTASIIMSDESIDEADLKILPWLEPFALKKT